MENTLVKRYNSQLVSAVAVFKGSNCKCDLQQDQQYVTLFEVSWLMYVRFLVYMQKEESKVNITVGHNMVSIQFLF